MARNTGRGTRSGVPTGQWERAKRSGGSFRPVRGSGIWSTDGLRWWFLFGERVRVGLVDHRRWDAFARASGVTPTHDGGYRYVHVGPYCLRLRGRPTASDD